MKPRFQTAEAKQQKKAKVFACFLGQLTLMAPNAAHIDHESGVEDHLRHTRLPTHRQFSRLAAKGVRHAPDGALNGSTPVLALSSRFNAALAQPGDLRCTSTDVQGANRALFPLFVY